ncbi:LexA/Signal peptidase [Setomelanomma holmii]|uniref:Mitochondrial inner membrane protease subunit n=1 Tax=Setomelanomma holmii TaxID=210430 RepID=A0A9P4LGS7_9PLEO|nr:LexA/Signal peptidase [Setomelanomma holmii]
MASRLFSPRLWSAPPKLTNPHSWGRVALRIGQFALVWHLVSRYIGGVGSTTGISMIPTIPSGYRKRPWVLYSALHRRGRGVKVGDVVIYTHPIFAQDKGCKRVIGMPGDFVSVVTAPRRDDDIGAEDVDGKFARVKEEVIQVPEGHCWVAGDNLEWSRDSRLYGPLPLALVKSKVFAVVLSFSDSRWLGSDSDLKDVQEKEHEWVTGT